MGEGNSFSLLVCPQEQGVPILARSMAPTPPPGQVRMGGGGVVIPRYLPPPAKVPNPPARSVWGEGVPQGTCPPSGQEGEGVTEGTYPLGQGT